MTDNSWEARMARCTIWLMLLGTFSLVGCGEAGDGNEGVLPGVESLVFVKRAFVGEDGAHVVSDGNRNSFDYLRYVPGGGLYVLSPPTPQGELRNLTAQFDAVDVSGVDVSFDAKQVAFAMRRAGDNHFHIYTANIDGSADVRQLTFGDWDDVRPLFVPGDRLAFVTNQPYTPLGTRADEYNHSRQVSQIGTISLVAGDADRRLCSQNLSHTADPFLLSDGRIGYSRWEHLGPVNDVKLFAMNPDCTQMVALSGQHGKPANSIVQATEIEPGVYVGVGMPRDRTIQAGALLRIDSRARAGAASIALDEQDSIVEVITPSVPVDQESPPSGVGRFRRPAVLPGTSNLLVSWADGDVNTRNELVGTAPNFGIYMWNPETREKTLVYDDPNTWDLYATAVRVREAPPVYPGVVGPAPDQNAPAIIGSVDITVTSLDESVTGASLDGMPLSAALGHARRVRVIEGFSSEIGPVGQFGLTMHDGAAILGEVPIQQDGSWEARVPPYLPYHLQPIDEYGMAIRNQLLWIQAMPGEQRRCGGCHERRSETILPRMGATTLAQQAGPVDLNIPIPERTELPWFGAASGNVQDLFNAKCVSCHSGGGGDPFAGRGYQVTVTTEDGETLMYDIPYLDLSDRPLAAYYEREAVTYPASYVSLVYPSATVANSVATGDVPPMWIIPGAARQSALIEAVNAQSEDGSSWAWDKPAHPEDVGVELTREERMLLIRTADLGGQYWTRRNIEGSDMWGAVEYPQP